MTIKWQNAALLLIAAALLGFFLAKETHITTGNSVREREFVRVRPDTAHTIVDVPLRSLHVNARANRFSIRTIHDTVFREACLDTLLTADTSTIAPDTLSVCYARNVFSICVALAPRRRLVAVPYLARDTFYWREDTIRVAENAGPPWYSDILVIIISLAAGLMIGKS